MIDLREIECTVLEYQISVLNELGKCYEKEFFMEADGDPPASNPAPSGQSQGTSQSTQTPQTSGGENKSEANPAPENKPQEGNNQPQNDQQQNNQQNNNNQQQNSKWEKFKNWFKEMMKKISDFFKKLFGKTTEAERVVETLEPDEPETDPSKIAAAEKTASEPVPQQSGQPFSNYGTIKCTPGDGIHQKLAQYYPHIIFNMYITKPNPKLNQTDDPTITPKVVSVVVPQINGRTFLTGATMYFTGDEKNTNKRHGLISESNLFLAYLQDPTNAEKKTAYTTAVANVEKMYQKTRKEFDEQNAANNQAIEQIKSGAKVSLITAKFDSWVDKGGTNVNTNKQGQPTSTDVSSAVFLNNVINPYQELFNKITTVTTGDNSQLPEDIAQSLQMWQKHAKLATDIIQLFSDREAELAKLATDKTTLRKIADEIKADPTEAQQSQAKEAKEKQKLYDTINENKQLTEQNQQLQQQLQQAGGTQPVVQPQVASQPAPAVQPSTQPTLVPPDSTEFEK